MPLHLNHEGMGREPSESDDVIVNLIGGEMEGSPRVPAVDDSPLILKV